MDLNWIATFVRVVDAGSFTGAADAIGTPKSSVSRSVSKLEEELGVRLLQRTTRRLGLTEAGAAYYQRVRGAVAGLAEADAAVAELGSSPRGVVRMTVPTDGADLLCGLLAKFARRFPAVHVQLIVTGRRVDLVAEGVDLALRAGRELDDSTLVARKIAEDRIALFAAPGYFRRRRRPERLADLRAHRCVLRNAHDGRETWKLVGPDGPEAVEVSGPVSADEIGFARRAVAAGLGIGLLPTLVADAALGLEPLMPQYGSPPTGVYLVMPSRQFVPARVLALRDFMVAELGRPRAFRRLMTRRRRGGK